MMFSNILITDEIAMVNTSSANPSITGSFPDILNIDNIDSFLQRDLNISGNKKIK